MQPGTDTSMQRFELFTDPARMQAVFQQRLPHFASGRLDITGCTILHTIYKTYLKAASQSRSSIAVVYRLDVTDQLAGSRDVQLVYSKAYLVARSQQVFEQALQDGQTVAHLADLDMVVWTFPNDPAMPRLSKAVDPQCVSAYLPYAALPAGIDGPDDITSVAVEVLNYRPELRCTARYTVRCAPSRYAEPLTVYGKTYSDEQGQAIEQLINHFAARGAARSGDFVRPRALGYSSHIGTLWLAELPGMPLASVIDGQNCEPLLDKVAHGLAQLHEVDSTGLARMTLRDRLAETHKKIVKLAHAFPQLRPTLDALAHDLAESLPDQEAGDDKLIHGDFHLQQLLIDGDRIGLLDFDDVARGDPLQDVAHFIVDLHHQRFDEHLVEQITAAFVQSYRARAAWDVPSERLSWHLSTQFVARAYRAYAQQKPHLEHTIRSLLRSAQQGSAVARRRG